MKLKIFLFMIAFMFSYATTTRNIRLSYRVYFDDFTGELSFEPIVKDCGY